MKKLFAVLTILAGVGRLQAQAPVITAQPVSTTVTLGTPVTLSVSATNATSYQWIRVGSYDTSTPINISKATSSSYTFTPTIADTGSLYAVAAYGPGGAVASSSAWIHVVPRTDVASVTNVENFGATTAAKVADTFGLGVDSHQPWEFAAVAAMGGKWVRADGCMWEHVEIQSLPSNVSGGFAPGSASDCASEVASAKTYGLHLDNTAYWAPPNGQVATVTTTADAPAGSSAISVSVTSGTLSGYTPTALLIFTLTSAEATAFNARIDGGAPIVSVSGTTLTLPEPTLADLPAGSTLSIHALLYPPMLIPAQSAGTGFVSNSSVQEYLAYLSEVAKYMHDSGVTGTLELWNEPENSTELWDSPADGYGYAGFYAHPPSHFSINGSGMALAYAATTLSLPSGIHLLNGWTNLSGNSSLYNANLLWALPVAPAQVNSVFSGEALHPYGNNPEQMVWLPDVIATDAASGVSDSFTETPIGGQIGANAKSDALWNLAPMALGGLNVSITETGLAAGVSSTETEEQRARFDVRQFLSFAGNHVYPIIFFKAGDAGVWDWFSEDSAHTPLPVAAAFTGLLSDVNQIANAPAAAYTSSDLPQVTSFKGYYPLASVSFVGSRTGDKANSILFYAWQKTYTVPPGGGSDSENYGTNGGGIPAMASWVTLASPQPVPVQVTIPSGYAVSGVKDVVTQTSESYTLSGRVITYSVADDPVQIMLTPVSASASAATIAVAADSVPYGTANTRLSATVGFTAGQTPTGAFTFTVDSGSTLTASCTASSASTEICNATYPTSALKAGYYTISGKLSAGASYSAASGTGTLTVTQSTPTVAVSNVTGSFNDATETLTAKVAYSGASAPAGTLSFQVGTGAAVPGSCTGSSSPLTCTVSYPVSSSMNAGANVITAKLATDANYLAASGTGVLTLASASDAISVSKLSAVYGTATVTLNGSVTYSGSTAPTGAFAFRVNGGSSMAATCTGSSSPLRCTATYNLGSLTPNTYTINGSLGADSHYGAASGTGTVTVTQAPVTLAIASTKQTYGAATATLSATEAFAGATAPAGALTVTVDSGSSVVAVCSGTSSPRSCTAAYPMAGLSTGTHTAKVTLASDTNYTAASSSGTFTITVANPTVTAANKSITAGTSSTTLSGTVAYTGSAAPTGAATFTIDGGAAIAAVCTGSSSPKVCTATAATSSLAAGAHTIRFQLAADADYSAASGTATLTVSSGTAAVHIQNASIASGTASATLSATETFSGPMPKGALTLRVDNGAAVTADCAGSSSPRVCSAPYATSSLSPGTHTITGTLAADASYPAAVGTGSLNVTPSAALSVTTQTISYGANTANLIATLTYNGQTAPTGIVSFSVDSGASVAAACSGSNSPRTCTATYNTYSLGAGSHAIAASLAADANYSSVAGRGTLAITAAKQTIVVTNKTVRAKADSATLKAALTYPGSHSPTGAVTFAIDSGKPVDGSCAAEKSSRLRCTADVSVSGLSAGTHTITVVSAADANYTAATAEGTVTVKPREDQNGAAGK